MSCDSSFEDLKIFYHITLAAAAGDAAVWALSDRYENPDSWGLFWKVWTAGCELMCVSKIWPFHLDKKCGTIHYLLRWPLQNDPKCVTQYHQKCRRVIRIGILWRWLIYGALSQKCAYNSCWLLPYGLFTLSQSKLPHCCQLFEKFPIQIICVQMYGVWMWSETLKMFAARILMNPE